MKELIDFLQQKEDDLELEKEDLEIVRKKRINGCGFLRITEKKLEKWTQKDLNEMLEKYGIVSGDIARIPQFIP
ncbi:hypothetical protein RhiirA5_428719, partial [Rhizophagus irregularis]